MSAYNQTYHSEIQDTAFQSAKYVIKIIIDMLHPHSVIDVGCGRGSWLKAWQDAGIQDIYGVDGGNQDVSQLLISTQYFKEFDLNKVFKMERKFDLVTCLEVVEHLHSSTADNIIQSLVSLSDKIIFSAAIPHQGGFKHLNEQWPSYWVEKFEKHGYVFLDALRWSLLSNEKIAWWYRQNLFIIMKKELYENSYSHLPKYSSEFYLMHKYVYKTYSSIIYKIYFTIQQFLYNNFNSLYHRILPFFKKILKSK